MKKSSVLCLIAFVQSVLMAAPVATVAPLKKQTDKEFFVFTDRGSKLNHYVESGWMGDFGDMKFNKGWKENPGKGETCIKVTYSGERKQGAGWTGIYWQSPANNWGDKRGGYDLSYYEKVTFLARGEKGGEIIDKFMVGGITGQAEEGDSDESATDFIELTKDWKKYEIDLKGRDMKHIIGGFGFALNADSNPKGATFYLDEIAFSKGKIQEASAK